MGPTRMMRSLGLVNWLQVQNRYNSNQFNIQASKPKKRPSTKKCQHAPEAPGPPVSMLLIITSQWPEQEWLFFFWRLHQALLSHNIEIGGPGVSNSSLEFKLVGCSFLKNPVCCKYLWIMYIMFYVLRTRVVLPSTANLTETTTEWT